MRKWFLRMLDRVILVVLALRVRRDRIASLIEQQDGLRAEHRRELAERDSRILLLEREIEHLAAITRRDLERVERETAIAAAGKQLAAVEVARTASRA